MTNEQLVVVHWEGPLTIEKACELNGDADYGVYQVCGDAISYGPQSLLYIGKAAQQTFGARMRQHDGWLSATYPMSNPSIYVGRFVGPEQPTSEEWDALIDKVERLLIWVHSPAFNGAGVAHPGPSVEALRVMNTGRYGRLLPEVSHLRWKEWSSNPWRWQDTK